MRGRFTEFRAKRTLRLGRTPIGIVPYYAIAVAPTCSIYRRGTPLSSVPKLQAAVTFLWSGSEQLGGCPGPTHLDLPDVRHLQGGGHGEADPNRAEAGGGPPEGTSPDLPHRASAHLSDGLGHRCGGHRALQLANPQFCELHRPRDPDPRSLSEDGQHPTKKKVGFLAAALFV
ncbi:hypothetical protein RF55_7128 [Lasius niger]|uniref:Uncharacterized protein n=1 Tax=Lasius niger TaxID=67767 RepID=A0A0J7NK24_LASNI|nr:hypothetical protein RF55_7128 [Lasius niger]